MIRKYIQIVDQAIDEGFDRGLMLYMENLEESLRMAELIAEHGEDKVMAETLSDGSEQGLEQIDEATIDAILEELKKGEK